MHLTIAWRYGTKMYIDGHRGPVHSSPTAHLGLRQTLAALGAVGTGWRRYRRSP